MDVVTGSVEATAIALPSPAPSGMQLVSGTSWDITTSVEFSGQAFVTVPYSDAGLSAEQEEGVKLYHFVNGQWQDITDSVNTAANTVSGYTSSFSPFAVFVPMAEEPPALPTTVTPASSAWSLVLLGLTAFGLMGYIWHRQHN